VKTLDKYILKNFLVGYVIAFAVLLGLRVIIDLFVNLDEFTEHPDLTALQVVANMLVFYGLNSTLYFRDFAGIITVMAAVFSLAKMVRSNEFVAMMASGVSLKRVIAPVVLVSILLAGLLVLDQEVVIPRLGDKLTRDEDDIPGQESYPVRFLADQNGSLIFAPRFDAETSTLHYPTILTRRRTPDAVLWEPTGKISAAKATYNPRMKSWDLINGRFMKKDSTDPPEPIDYYTTDITPKDILMRRKSEYKTLLSWSQLVALEKHGTRIRDLTELYSQKHFRVTDPIINVVMLLVCLPILVCRDPKSMKTAVVAGFVLTGACLMTVFVSKMLATEAFMNKIEFWAWLPIFIFLPAALFELDAMKT